jgi:hypothetical protein
LRPKCGRDARGPLLVHEVRRRCGDRHRPSRDPLPSAISFDGKGRPEAITHEEKSRDGKQQMVVPHRHRCLNPMNAEIIQATPPSVPIPAPTAANTLAVVGSDRSAATVTTNAPIVQKIAATRFHASPLTGAAFQRHDNHMGTIGSPQRTTRSDHAMPPTSPARSPGSSPRLFRRS